MDLSTDLEAVNLYVGSGKGSIMLVPPSPSAQFFTIPSGTDLTQPLDNDRSCDRFDLVAAEWLLQDVDTMLPAISWWALPDLQGSVEPQYVYTCDQNVITSRGVVEYSIHHDSIFAHEPQPTGAPTPAPITEFRGTWDAVGEDFIDIGLGTTVALSDNGRIMALGSPMAINADTTSSVTVYRLRNGKWKAYGPVINGDEPGNGFGQAVSLSADGHTLAVGAHRHNEGAGAVRVFRMVDKKWVQMGNDMEGLFAEDSFGVSLDISPDGLIVAAGAHGFDLSVNSGDEETTTLKNAGQVRVFKFDEIRNEWELLGLPLTGTGVNDNLGYYTSVTVMDDKDATPVVAAGARGIDGDKDEAGHVRVYWYREGSWQRMGQALDTTAYNAGTGRVSLAKNGLRLTAGSVWAAEKAGKVCVYEYDLNGNQWNLLGNPMYGLQPEDQLGHAVDISDDGNTIAAGAVFHGNQNETNVGQVHVYRYVERQQEWIKLGSAIDGIEENDYWGRSVSLAANGNRLVGGAYWFNSLSQRGYNGRVRVVDFRPDA